MRVADAQWQSDGFISHSQVGSIPTGGTETKMEIETIIIELRAAEGGEDAKLLVEDMLSAYVNACDRRRL